MLPAMATPSTTSPFATSRPRAASAKALSIRRATSQLLPNIVPFPVYADPPRCSPTDSAFSMAKARLLKRDKDAHSPPVSPELKQDGVSGTPPGYSSESISRRKKVLTRKSAVSLKPVPSLDVVPTSPPGTRRTPIHLSHLHPPPSEATSDATPRATTFAGVPWSKEGSEPRHAFRYRRGMKLHAYPRAEAPYVVSYNSIMLQTEASTLQLYTRLAPHGSPSFTWLHKKPPARALDIGCGHGGWVAHAARCWKGSRIVALDLVDARTDAWDLSKSIAESVEFRQHNVLTHRLPFKDNSFDYIRMADLALAVPYDAWAPLLQEAHRILAPGGQLELIDDQLIFPYRNPRRASLPPTPASEKDFLELESPAEERAPDGEDPWERKASASRALETVFANMLLRKYRVHPQPHEFLDGALSTAFSGHARRTHNMHLALPAEVGSARSSLDRDGETSSIDTGSFDSLSYSPPVSRQRSASASVHFDPDRRSSGSSVSSLAPGGIPAKAAGILGIAESPPVPANPALPLPSPTTTSSFGASVTIPSKAAGLLGLRDAPAPREPEGLVLWPGTFLSMSPGELDDAAGKGAHVLLGAKAALVEFAAEHVDARGAPLVAERELEEWVWDYERFRRERLGLSTDRPLEDEDDFEEDQEGKRGHRRRSSTFDGPRSRPVDHQRERFGDLTFVRAIRVWEARKPAPVSYARPKTAM